ncbi:N-acetylmuramoyl-L-alanine amidase [Rhinopithecimicrobium faecis]
MKYLFLLGSLCSFYSLMAQQADTLQIEQRPITWNEEREQLSIEYLKNRHGIAQNSAIIKPTMVVVHWTAVMSLDRTFQVFDPVKLPARPELQKVSPLNVSAQFLVDRDGHIVQVLPDSVFARHTIGLNYCAIGIENIGSDKYPLTPAQLAANTKLIHHLAAKYPIQYVIGHHEYQAFKNTPLWKETDPTYITQKSDPGKNFMMQLRGNLSELQLKEIPVL